MLYYPILPRFSYGLDDRLIESQLDSSCTDHSGWLHQILHFPSSKPPLHIWTFLYPAFRLYVFSLTVFYPLYLLSRFLDFFLLTLHTEDLNLGTYMRENMWHFYLGPFPQHDCFQFYSCIYKLHDLILLCDWVIFFCVYVPRLLTFLSLQNLDLYYFLAIGNKEKNDYR